METQYWIKLAEIFLPPIITVVLAWIVGERISAHWAARRKGREDAQARSDHLFEIYGQFFSNWKLWNYFIDSHPEERDDRFHDIFRTAAEAEGKMEALLVTLCAELRLEPNEAWSLGRFRQGYQSLREGIRDGKRLEWISSEHEQYLAFKRLAVSVATLAALERHERLSPAPPEAINQIRMVTSNKWEDTWWLEPKS